MIAFVFPGQGSQAKLMGKALYNKYPHINILDKISNYASVDVKQLCFEDSESKLNDSVNSALAVFSISALVLEILKLNSINPNAYAGYSVGYFSALYAAGYISLKNACDLIKIRAELLKKSA